MLKLERFLENIRTLIIIKLIYIKDIKSVEDVEIRSGVSNCLEYILEVLKLLEVNINVKFDITKSIKNSIFN